MKTRAELLAWKRQVLIAECRAQRADLAMQIAPVVRTLESVETGARIVGRVVHHPEWIAGLALGLAVIRPRRLSSLFRSGTMLLRTWRSVAPALGFTTTRG